MILTRELPPLFDHLRTSRTTTVTPSYQDQSDMVLSVAELLAEASAGNAPAWAEIVRRYGGLVTAKARSFRLQNADVLDAVQATWLRLAANFHRIQFPEHLGGWLSTTTTRECLRILRDTKNTSFVPYASEAVTDSVDDRSIGPEQHVIDAETAQELRSLVAELPPRHRSLLAALFTDDPMPYSEISHTIGIPIGSIGPTRARVLQQLRRMVDERGLDWTAHPPR